MACARQRNTIICSRFGRRAKQWPCIVCGKLTKTLCDGPSETRGQTCDRPVCSEHATHLDGHDIDYCPQHDSSEKRRLSM